MGVLLPGAGIDIVEVEEASPSRKFRREWAARLRAKLSLRLARPSAVREQSLIHAHARTMAEDTDGKISQGFPVLLKHVPYIVGRGGRNVDAIEKASGCSVSIVKNPRVRSTVRGFIATCATGPSEGLCACVRVCACVRGG